MRDLTGVVLCGGRGSRMGGLAKPLLGFGGRPLLESVLEALLPQVDTVILSVNQETERFGAYGYACIGDGPLAHCGPLAGMLASLAVATTADVLFVPGDAPRLPPDLAARLEDARRIRECAAAYVFDGCGPQPLCCLVSRRLLKPLKDYLAAGGNSPQAWLKDHGGATADYSGWPSYAWSLNTPEEWRSAEAGVHP